MYTLQRQSHIDLTPFQCETGTTELEAKYGLPIEVRFCRGCGISNQRPNSAQEAKTTSNTKKETINFNQDDICDACLAAERKSKTDWHARDQQLRELCDRHRRKDGKFDCVVPGSGGKDSVYAAHVLKYEYNMHPLTVTWAPHIYTEWGWRNQQSWIHSGFDNMLITPNGKVHRLLTRLALERLFHPFQPFVLGQKQLAPILARQFDIPLVFYGENEAEYGNPVKENEQAIRSAEYFTAEDSDNIYLSGFSVNQLMTDFGLDRNDLRFYMPSSPDLLATGNVETHYLGYYLKWHPQSCYYYAVENCGFEASPERTPGTFSKYNSLDDRMDDFHFYTTFIKFGIGRASYDACQEVRSGDIEREEAVHLIKRFDGEFPERFAEQLFAYLSIPEHEFPVAAKMFEQPMMDRLYFEHLCDRFRSPHLWRLDAGEWKLRHAVWH